MLWDNDLTRTECLESEDVPTRNLELEILLELKYVFVILVNKIFICSIKSIPTCLDCCCWWGPMASISDDNVLIKSPPQYFFGTLTFSSEVDCVDEFP